MSSSSSSSSNPLTEPSAVYSKNGLLHTSIHLTAASHVIEPNPWTGDAFQLTTRSLNGTLPGPTLYLKPGDTLVIDFYNDLEDDDDADDNDNSHTYHHNSYSAPNESNLHFHGLHVSGELPSDDVTHVIPPGQHYRYNTTLPLNHLPGTHYMHPHRHGSTALQVGGGAAAAVVVQDTDAIQEELPPEITQAPELVVLIQEMKLGDLQSIAKKSGDRLLQLTQLNSLSETSFNSILDVEKDRFYLTNGQVNPSVMIQPNQWVRLRVIHSGWLKGSLKLTLDGCNMQLIAKDGIYLPLLPRTIQHSELVNAGRADIMVQCPFSDKEKYEMMSNNQNQPVLTFLPAEESNVENTQSTGIIPTTSISFPDYLQDLRHSLPTPGCSCETKTSALKFPTNLTDYFHETYQGAIVERQLSAGSHPYHQHVHPFQIVRNSPSSGNYYQVGDWHDTIGGNPTVRYQPTVFTGKVMIHCHVLSHEDTGMMALEYIHPVINTTLTSSDLVQSQQCKCGKVPPLLQLWTWVMIALAGVIVMVIPMVWCLRRRYGRCLWIPLPTCCQRYCSNPAAFKCTEEDADQVSKEPSSPPQVEEDNEQGGDQEIVTPPYQP